VKFFRFLCFVDVDRGVHPFLGWAESAADVANRCSRPFEPDAGHADAGSQVVKRSGFLPERFFLKNFRSYKFQQKGRMP
jgi:hypothetical protein